jgi:DNA-directed RNA polymerase specialized sigma24 family protein
LKDLPEEQANLLRQSFFEDKSHADIAKETGLPLGTVKSRIRLTLERLRKNKTVRELWQ